MQTLARRVALLDRVGSMIGPASREPVWHPRNDPERRRWTVMAQPVSGARPPGPKDHRWLILVIVAIAQLMVVRDATIVNIALPSAQLALGFPNADRQWIVTAYALSFGGLLLLGG